MSKRRVFLTFITVLLAVSLLVGCGEKTSTKDLNETGEVEEGENTEKASNGEGEDGREMVGNMYTSGLPIVKEPETFSIMVDDGGMPEDKIMYPILEEQTNVKVDLMLYPYEVALEKKNIAINSGDYPDAIGGWILSADEILTSGMEEGLYIPIDDLIEKYSPKMQEILEIEGVRDTMTLPDGHIYTIPYVIDTPLVSFLPYINTEWLENVDKEMPKTPEEFKDVLRAFKEEDANGNGDPNDEVPFSADPNNKNLGLLAGWFGVPVPEDGFTIIDGELTFVANCNEYKEGIKFLSDLYAEDLIDLELFTQDLSQWKAKGKQGILGCSIAYGSGDFLELEPDGETPYRALPVLTAPGVSEPRYHRGSSGVTVFKNQLAITDKAENPEVIIRYWDNVFEEENSMQIQNGFFGKRLEKLDDGSYRRLDESKLSETDQEKYDWANVFTQSLPKYCPIGIDIKPAEGMTEPFDEKEEADNLYEPYLTEMIPSAWVSQDDAKRLSILNTDITNYIEQKQAEWITGHTDVEEEWDEYKEHLEKLGLEELIQIRKDAIEK